MMKPKLFIISILDAALLPAFKRRGSVYWKDGQAAILALQVEKTSYGDEMYHLRVGLFFDAGNSKDRKFQDADIVKSEVAFKEIDSHRLAPATEFESSLKLEEREVRIREFLELVVLPYSNRLDSREEVRELVQKHFPHHITRSAIEKLGLPFPGESQ